MATGADFVDELCGDLSGVNINGDKLEIKEENVSKSVSIKPTELSEEEKFWWEKLMLLQCPFTWDDLQAIESDDKCVNKSKTRVFQIEEKLEEIEEPDTFKYRELVLNLVLLYEHFRIGNSGTLLVVLRETEALLSSSLKTAGALSKFINDINVALQHIVLSCRVFVQFYSHVLSEVERTFAKIIQFDDLNDVCKAAVYGIHAGALMEYGHKGNIAAMSHIETALNLDPNQGEWHFLLGKCLGRLRRIDFSFQIPAEKELKALENAVRMTKNPPYIVFLAQSYRETALRVYSEQRGDRTPRTVTNTIDKMNERSLQLYKEALVLRPDCSHMKVRCALGFMKLPHRYKDLHLAKKCLDEALKQAPNNAMVNHNTAMYYEKFERNMAEAKKYYKRATELGAFGSYMDMLRVEYHENRFDYNPIPDLEIGLEKYQEVPYQQELMLQMGSYYLFIKDDVENAFKYWEKVIDKDPDANKLKNHKCNFLHMLKTVNVYEVLCDESRLILQLKPYKAKGKESLYQKIIIKCLKHFPACTSTSPIPRRRMVLAEVDEVERRRFRSKAQGRGRGRGRGLGKSGRGDRDHSFDERGRGNRGFGERGRGNRGFGERGRGNRGFGERGRAYRSGERGRGVRGGGNRSRDSSTDSRCKDYSGDGQGSAVGRGDCGNEYDGRYSRDSSVGSYRRNNSKERQGFRGRGGVNQTRSTNYDGGRYSRDSSADSYRRHHSNERRGGFGGSRGDHRTNNTGAYHRRESSGNNCYNEDKQRYFQNYDGPGEHRRDSSAESRSSCGSFDSVGGRERSWRWGGRWRGNSHEHKDVESSWRTGPRERNNSESSTEGSVARKLSAGRVRTDSASSVNCCPGDVKVDWRQGCKMSQSPGISEDFVNARNKHF